MSWFKKIIEIFKSEEERYIEDSSILKDQNTNMESNESKRDIDAKIVYQYPKGQFRFPVIPDEEIHPRSRRERKKSVTPPAEPVKSTRSQHRKKTGEHRVKGKEEKVTEIHKNHVKKIQPSSKPFRPTEIPSPIYGFENRRRTTPIEYELGNFSEIKKEPPLDEGTNIRVTEDQPPQAKEKDVVEPFIQKELVETDACAPSIEEASKTDVELEVSVVSETMVATEAEESEVESRELDFSIEVDTNVDVMPEGNTIPETTGIEESEIVEVEASPESTVALERDLSVNRASDMGMVTDQGMEDTELEEPDTVEGENTETAEPVETAALFEQVPTIEKVSEGEPELEEEDALFQEKQASVETEISSDSDMTEVEEEPTQKEEKRRSHIPFNVIMLKEDKRKLEERMRQKIAQENEQEQHISEPEVEVKDQGEEPYYAFPSLELLNPPVFKSVDEKWLEMQEQLLNETLLNFNVRASVANVTQGPSVTRFEVHPEPGVKVNKIKNLADDIKLSLAAKDIRMEAPIPGTHMIGIEVPNQTSRPVLISEIITSEKFRESTSPLTAVLGLDISGAPIVTDLRKMPHGLIAGATGSGKSVCINSILVSLLYKANPNEVKLMLIDPKMVELAPYNQIPHLVSPVITDVKAATAALKWAVDEMERRYELFAHAGVREINRFNELAEEEKNYSAKLPYIVIVIDELADLMMMSPADVEEAICRIAQKARACGIHLIIATQRPSVDVITGLIKANVPTRIAFSVSSQVDSRTIIDISGAVIAGRGDMLFLENGSSKPVRLQGTFVADEEIDSIVAHVKKEQRPNYLFEQEELLKKSLAIEEEDDLFQEACEYIVEQGGASTSSLQRKFKIGYNRAARLIDMMEEQGFISEAKGSKPRDVLITESELQTILDEQ